MNRHLMGLVVVGLWAWLLVGCVSTVSDVKSSTPGPASATLSCPGMGSRATNQIARNSPFGKYDSALVAAVEKRWADILSAKSFRSNKKGKVVVQFHLNPDGTVSAIEILENQTGILPGAACEGAINGSAPFAPWPPDMTKMVGKDYREVTFTFYYY